MVKLTGIKEAVLARLAVAQLRKRDALGNERRRETRGRRAPIPHLNSKGVILSREKLKKAPLFLYWATSVERGMRRHWGNQEFNLNSLKPNFP